MLELVLSLASKEMVYRGFSCHQHPPCAAHAGPGVTGEEPAASSPHGPSGKGSCTMGAKSCSPSHNPHTASSRDSLVHKSQQEVWTCPGQICQSRGQLFPIMVVSTSWYQDKGLLFLGTSARLAGRVSGTCLGLYEEMAHVDGWEGWEAR